MRDKKGHGSGWEGGGEECGGIERRETIVRIYYMKKKSIFNVKGKKRISTPKLIFFNSFFKKPSSRLSDNKE